MTEARAGAAAARWLGGLLAACLSLVAFAVVGEGVVRFTGLAAPAQTRVSFRIEPANGRLYEPDEVLGYRMRANQSVAVFGPGSHAFSVSTDASGRRSLGRSVAGLSLPQVWLFGDSFTFGWGVNDAETWASRLQEWTAGHEVLNFAVSGYSTVQAYLALEKALAGGGRPAIVILGHLGFHDSRNVMSPSRSQELGFAWRDWGESEQPYLARGADGGWKVLRAGAYRPFMPLTREMAFAAWVERRIVQARERWAQKTDGRKAATAYILREFIALARRHKAVVVVGDLGYSGNSLRRLVEQEGATFFSAGVRYQEEGMSVPMDGHPSVAAHLRIAEAARLALVPHIGN